MKAILPALLAACMTLVCATAASQTGAEALPLDKQGAIEWCRTHTLDRIEGVWSYPQDRVTVLIHKADTEGTGYNVSVVESEKLSLRPGELLGTVSATAEPDKFSMTLFTSKTKGKLSRPRKCALTLTADDSGLTVRSKVRKWRINPFAILPYFWKVARVSESDPMKTLPVGMIRLHPSYDGNGSSRHHVRYL